MLRNLAVTFADDNEDRHDQQKVTACEVAISHIDVLSAIARAAQRPRTNEANRTLVAQRSSAKFPLLLTLSHYCELHHGTCTCKLTEHTKKFFTQLLRRGGGGALHKLTCIIITKAWLL